MTVTMPAPSQVAATPTKSFVYRTTSEWMGRRKVAVESVGKPSLRISSPPEFRGDAGLWTPEEMFVASIESCLLITFSAIAERQKLPVQGYYSETEGTLELDGNRWRFTRITVRPTIIISDVRYGADVVAAIEKAHRECLLVNSTSTVVEVRPDVEIDLVE